MKHQVDSGSERRPEEFLTALSDEFRNSLGSLRNAVQVLKLVGSNDDQILRVQGVLDRQVSQLGRLLEDLLDLSRLSRGSLRLHTEMIPLDEVTGRAASLARPQIEARGLLLQLQHTGGGAWLRADGQRLAQVLANLIDEVGRRAPGRAAIQFRSAIDGDLVLLSIASPVRFEPAGAAEAFGHGNGLRLQLARRMIELHHGIFEGRLRGDGGGLEFVVHLPVSRRPTVPVATAPPQTQLRTNDVGEHARARRILVIDDNTDAAESLALILSLEGHAVRTAHDGFDGIELARLDSPEVVFIDIGLPGIDGFEVARRMRQLPGMRDALLIAVTGFDRHDLPARSRDAGIDRHLVKPVDPAALGQLLTLKRIA